MSACHLGPVAENLDTEDCIAEGTSGGAGIGGGGALNSSATDGCDAGKRRKHEGEEEGEVARKRPKGVKEKEKENEEGDEEITRNEDLSQRSNAVSADEKVEEKKVEDENTVKRRHFWSKFVKTSENWIEINKMKDHTAIAANELAAFLKDSGIADVTVNGLKHKHYIEVFKELSKCCELACLSVDCWEANWSDDTLVETFTALCKANSPSGTFSFLSLKGRMNSKEMARLLPLFPSTLRVVKLCDNMLEKDCVVDPLMDMLGRTGCVSLDLKHCPLPKTWRGQFFKGLCDLGPLMTLENLEGIDFEDLEEVPKPVKESLLKQKTAAWEESKRFGGKRKVSTAGTGGEVSGRSSEDLPPSRCCAALLDYCKERALLIRLVGRRVRVWWAPTIDEEKSEFGGRFWPAVVKGVNPVHRVVSVQYDNQELEHVSPEMLQPDNPCDWGGAPKEVGGKPVAGSSAGPTAAAAVARAGSVPGPSHSSSSSASSATGAGGDSSNAAAAASSSSSSSGGGGVVQGGAERQGEGDVLGGLGVKRGWGRLTEKERGLSIWPGEIVEFRDPEEYFGSDPSDFIGVVERVNSKEPLYTVRNFFVERQEVTMVRSGDIRRARICQWPTYKEAELRRLRSEKWLLLYGDHPEEPAEQLKEVKDEMEAAKPVFSYLQPLGPPKQTEGQKGEGAVPSPSQQSCVGGGLGGDPSGEGHARGRGKGGKGKGKGKDGEHVRTRGRGGRGGRGKGRSMSATCEVVDGLCPPPVGVGEGGSTGVVGMDLDGHAHAEPPPLPSAPLSPSRASVLPHSPGGPPPFPAAAASSALPPSSLSRQVEKEKGRGGKGASQSGSRVSLASPFPVSSSKENTKEKKSAEPGRGPEDLSSSGVALLGWQCPYERDICAYPRWTEEEYAHWHDEQVRQFGEHPSLRVCGGGKKAARVRLRAQPVEALVERVLELEETESELRQMKARRVVQDAECSKLREQTDELRLEVSRYRDLVSCVICRDRRRVAVLQPCQHFAFCSECTKGLRVCPLCRTHITKTLNLRVDDLNA